MKNLLPHFIVDKFNAAEYNGKIMAVTLFLDISGFTVMTEALMQTGKEGAEVLSQILNTVFEPTIRLIYEHGGFITIFAGDAFTAVFPYTADNEKSVVLATAETGRMVLDLFQQHKTVNSPLGSFELAIKIGMSAGEMEWQIIQGEELNGFCFKGFAVEDCAQAEHLAQKGELLISPKLSLMPEFVKISTRREKYLVCSKPLTVAFKKQKPVIAVSQKTALRAFYPAGVINFNDLGEFRQVTSVFISFDDSATQTKIDQFLRLVGEKAFDHQGYFNKIDFGDKGGVLLVIFGAPVSLENNIEPALNFLLTLKNQPQPISWKGGVTYGTVYAGFVGSDLRSEYTVLGDNVNLASRLMSSAPAGQIFCSESIRNSALERFNFKEAGNFKLKGIAGNTRVFSLISTRQENQSRGKQIFVGRVAELNCLQKKELETTNSACGQCIYISGEAGIGKTRLIGQFTATAKLKFSYFFTNPALQKSFGMMDTFLRDYFKTASGENSKNIHNFETIYTRLLKQCTAQSPELVPEMERIRTLIAGFMGIELPNSIYPLIDPENRTEALQSAFQIFLTALIYSGCQLLIFDDWQWIDQQSSELMQKIFADLPALPVLIVVTSRGKLADSSLKDIGKTAITELNMDAFSATELSQFYQNRFNLKFCAEMLEFLQNKTMGNPFYCEQFGHYLLLNNYLKESSEGWTLKIAFAEIPDSINDILIARIDALTENVKKAVKAASVLQNDFEKKVFADYFELVNQLDTVKQRNLSGIDQIMIAGEKADIWDNLHDIRYIFRHSLLKDAAYGMQLTSRLKKLHLIAADLLKSIFGEDKKYFADIAWHYQKAGENNSAATYWLQAGEEELELFNMEKSFEYLQNGLNLLTKHQSIDIRVKTALYEKIGAYYKYNDDMENAFKFLKKAFRLLGKYPDNLFKGKMYNSKGLFLKDLCEYSKAAFCYRKAEKLFKLAEDTKAEDWGALYNNQGFVALCQSRFLEAENYFKQALTIFSTLDKKSVDTAKSHNNLSNLYYKEGRIDKAFEFAYQSQKIFEEILPAGHYYRALILNNLATYHHQKGEYSKAIDSLLEAEKSILATLGKDNSDMALLYNNLAAVYEGAGNYEKAGCFYEEALNIYRRQKTDQTLAASYLYNNLSLVKIKYGELNEARKLAELALEIQIRLLGTDSAELIISYANLAALERDAGNYPQSDSYLHLAFVLADNNFEEDNYYHLALLHSRGKLFFWQQDFNNCTILLKQASDMAEKLGEPNRITSIYAFLALAAFHTCQFDHLHLYAEKLNAKFKADALDYENGLIQTVSASNLLAADRLYNQENNKKTVLTSLAQAEQCASANLNSDTVILTNLYQAIASAYYQKIAITSTAEYKKACTLAEKNQKIGLLEFMGKVLKE